MIKRKKNKIGKDSKNNYHIWSSGRLSSLILIGLSILFFILSIVEVPFLSAIPKYTFGLLFGYYSFVFYLFLIYYATCKLFNINIYIIKAISKIRVFNYSWLSFFILVFGVILIIETSIYMTNNKSPFPGVEAWNINFNTWWKDFTISENALKPNVNNSGVLVTLVLSTLYSIGGTIVSIIFSILLIFYYVFYLFFSSPLNKFSNKKENKKKIQKENNEYETKIVDLSFEDDHKIVVSDFGTKIIENIDKPTSKPNLNLNEQNLTNQKNEVAKGDEKIVETIPFDNPFDEPDSFISNEKVTQEINIKRNKREFEDTEFIFNNEGSVENDNKTPNVYNQTSEIKLDKNINKKKNKKRGK
ncbi:MAG: hypothetical protein ACRC1F_01370 [Metamycoplasmataceae bacterium]